MNTKSRLIYIPADGDEIQGDLRIPEDSKAIVIFAHESGSSRHSPRNQYVAGVLNDGRIATLLIDLLTPDEEVVDLETSQLRFDIDLLAERLSAVTNWLRGQSATEKFHIGYFGASTGAAAALVAAAKHPQIVEAIVSRGGRPDLAGPRLVSMHAPTLLIVGCLMFLRMLLWAPVRPMSGFCSILIAIVMLMHLQCAASCLSESPGNTVQTTPVSSEPPCHQHANVPANSPHAPHETNTPCTQGPVVEAKILLSGKWVQHLIAVLPVAVPILYLDEPAKLTFATYSPRDLWFPPISLSVLRI